MQRLYLSLAKPQEMIHSSRQERNIITTGVCEITIHCKWYDARGVLRVGSIPVSLFPSCQHMMVMHCEWIQIQPFAIILAIALLALVSMKAHVGIVPLILPPLCFLSHSLSAAWIPGKPPVEHQSDGEYGRWLGWWRCQPPSRWSLSGRWRWGWALYALLVY